MAEPGVPIPESITWISGVVGIALAAGATVIGWYRGKAVPAAVETQVAGGIVDSRSVKILVDCIDEAVDDLKSSRAKDVDSRDELTTEVKKLRIAIEDFNERARHR